MQQQPIDPQLIIKRMSDKLAEAMTRICALEVYIESREGVMASDKESSSPKGE